MVKITDSSGEVFYISKSAVMSIEPFVDSGRGCKSKIIYSSGGSWVDAAYMSGTIDEVYGEYFCPRRNASERANDYIPCLCGNDMDLSLCRCGDNSS